ncbi:MAG: GTP-binding protein [Cyanobacteria bacterium P01_G01_bin.38]
MRRLHPALIAIATLTALGLFLLLVSAIANVYAGVAVVSPLLAQGVVVLLMGILIAAVGVLAYYARLFLRPRRQRPLPPPPETATEAASANLEVIQRQIDQVQDEVARQALLAKSQSITQEFQRRAFKIVIFGTGSAGKTALANALIGEIAGEVAPTRGTTVTGQTYRLVVAELERELWLTDSPGLLEVGGTAQETESRRLATTADLLLYVVDNDLHRAEYESLCQLLRVGKRTLLVFNKTDRYPTEEVAQILKQLRLRLRGLLSAESVVAIAAQPQAVTLTNGSEFQPEPDIAALVEPILQVLRTEGEELIADNLLLQSQQLGQEARQQLSAQRQRQADVIIDRYQWIGAGVLAATPLPVVDMLATAAVNTQMVVELGKVYGVEVSIEDARALSISLAKTMTSLGLVKGALKLLSVGLQATIATAIAGKLLQGASAAYLTRIAGKSFIEYFRQNQTWGDGGMQAVIEQQYQLNRREDVVRQFMQTAVNRMISTVDTDH